MPEPGVAGELRRARGASDVAQRGNRESGSRVGWAASAHRCIAMQRTLFHCPVFCKDRQVFMSDGTVFQRGKFAPSAAGLRHFSRINFVLKAPLSEGKDAI